MDKNITELTDAEADEMAIAIFMEMAEDGCIDLSGDGERALNPNKVGEQFKRIRQSIQDARDGNVLPAGTTYKFFDTDIPQEHYWPILNKLYRELQEQEVDNEEIERRLNIAGDKIIEEWESK